MSERSPVKLSSYVGIFCVALATLMYQVLLTRIFSVTMLYHFAFVAVSVAMFGMTVGALVVYLRPQVFRVEHLSRHLAVWAIVFPLAIVFSFLTQLSLPFRVHPSVVAVYSIVLTYVVIAVPFVVSGIVVCLVLTGYSQRVSRLYAADLAGAALGCALLIPVLDYSDGPTAVMWTAFLASLGAVAFARTSTRGLRLASVTLAVLLALAAIGNTVLVWRQFPVFRILYVKGSLEARPKYEKWNSYSRVRVNGDENALVAPKGWGLSRTLPPDLRARQLQMDIDVVAGTVMTGYDGNPATVPHLAYDITNLPYMIRPGADALVIGAGGGRDVLSAVTLGARSVVAVELNTDIIKTVNGRFGDFTGHLDRNPKVRFVADEARSFLARSSERFGLIQISLIDTWAATAAGAFVLSENSLYTTEAWTLFLQRLSGDGMLSVSRWYNRDNPGEMYRTVALATKALRAVGVADPRPHLMIVRNMDLARQVDAPDGVGTLLVSARPFTTEEVQTAQKIATDLAFEVMFSPVLSQDQTFDQIVGPDGAAFVANYPLRISAPTDDSPFFFNMLRWRDILNLSALESGKQSNNLKAVATLGLLLGTVVLLSGLCIVGPLWAGPRVAIRESLSLFIFFIAIGLGFMLVEMSQMQRLIIALGHPTYALSVVLFALLLSSGIGSFLTHGIRPERLAAAGTSRLLGLVAVLVALGLVTPTVVQYSAGGSTPVRIGLAVLLLFPQGLLMGMAFPLGLTVARRGSPALMSWLWGLNGAASVVASVLSVCIALTWSISAAFWCGCAAYVVALLSFRRAARVVA